LISQATDSSSDDTPYETYVAPLLDMLNLYEYPNNADLNANMPLALKHDDNYFPDSNKIIRNFLFADAKSTSALGSSIDPFPDQNVLIPSNSNAGILQLASIYKNDGTEDAKKIELFNPKSATDTYD
jgi:hypothetical protein